MLSRGEDFLTASLPFLFPSSIPVEERWIMVLSVYLDESEQSSEVYAVAGYVFNAEECLPFGQEWKDALRSASPPLSRFHMNKFENSKGSYTGWSDETRFAFLEKLVGIMHRHSQLLVFSALDLKAFSAQSDAEKSILGARTPYLFCVNAVLAEVVKWMHGHGHTEKMNYFLDDLQPGQGKTEIKEVLSYISKSRERRNLFQILNIVWADSTQTVQLQAADILAYEVAKEAARQWGYSKHQRRKSLGLLVDPPTTPKIISRFIGVDDLPILRGDHHG